LLNFFKKNFKIVVVLISVFLIIAFINISCLSCENNPGEIKGPLVIAHAGDINNLTVDDIDIDKSSKDDTGVSYNLDTENIRGDENYKKDEVIIEEQPEEPLDNNDPGQQEQENQVGMSESDNVKEENAASTVDDNVEVDFSNSDDFKIEVDLSVQKVFIFYEDNPIREMICSGGTEEKPTPVGEFKTTQKGYYFWSDKYKVGAYYWVRFYNEYLFHSVPFDAEGQMIEEEFEKLGSPASHGCIRLKLEDAKWLYDTLPIGIKVLIY